MIQLWGPVRFQSFEKLIRFRSKFKVKTALGSQNAALCHDNLTWFGSQCTGFYHCGLEYLWCRDDFFTNQDYEAAFCIIQLQDIGEITVHFI